MFFVQLEQAVVKEMAWFRDTAQSLEKLKDITLDPELISEQLYEQKVSMLFENLKCGEYNIVEHTLTSL